MCSGTRSVSYWGIIMTHYRVHEEMPPESDATREIWGNIRRSDSI